MNNTLDLILVRSSCYYLCSILQLLINRIATTNARFRITSLFTIPNF